MALSSRLGRSVPRPDRTTTARPASIRAPVTCHAVPKTQERWMTTAGSSIAAFLASAALLLDAGAAHANSRGLVSEFQASGFLFKDVVEVTALEDPEIDGVTIYFSDFKRNIVDKLSKDFFSEPSQASLTCTVTGPVHVKDPKRISQPDGSELFSEGKGLNLFRNKTLRVRRVYDADRRTVVYVAYSTRLTSATDDGGASAGRYKTSMCALTLPPPTPAPALAADAAVPAAPFQP